MKSNNGRSYFTFGEFIAQLCDVYGERNAKGLVGISIKAHLIEFQNHNVSDCLKALLNQEDYKQAQRRQRPNPTIVRTRRVMNSSPDHSEGKN